MVPNELTLLVLSAAVIFAGVFFYWWRREHGQVRGLIEDRAEAQRRLEASRAEVGAVKEEARKRRSELAELREQARKTKRKRGRKGQRDDAEQSPKDSAELNKAKEEAKRLTDALAGAESRVQRLQETRDAELESARSGARAEATEQAEKRIAELKTQLEEQEGRPEKAAPEETAPASPPEPARPEAAPADVRIDLATLPEEAVAELRRFYKKASNFEKLYLVANGKLNVVSEKHDELTRRYYAVCRELALAAGKSITEGGPGDQEAARLAQEAVSTAEDAAKRRRRRPKTRRPKRRERDAGPPPSDEPAAGGAVEAETGAAPADALEVAEASEAPKVEETATSGDATEQEARGAADEGETGEERPETPPAGSP